MPELSRFYGIIIKMHHHDHTPPHFHVEYGEFEAQFSIQGLKVIEGRVPSRVKSLVREWAGQHIAELIADWELVSELKQPRSIKPLE